MHQEKSVKDNPDNEVLQSTLINNRFRSLAETKKNQQKDGQTVLQLEAEHKAGASTRAPRHGGIALTYGFCSLRMHTHTGAQTVAADVVLPLVSLQIFIKKPNASPRSRLFPRIARLVSFRRCYRLRMLYSYVRNYPLRL